MLHIKETHCNSDSITLTVELKLQTKKEITIWEKLDFIFYNTYMSSADIFMTPTHNACCFPSAIIA